MTRNLLCFSLGLGLLACDNADTSASDASASDRTTPAPAAIGAPPPKTQDQGFALPLTAVSITASDAAKKKASEILARAKDGALERADQSQENAEALVWVAASSASPELVAEALYALAELKGPLPRTLGEVVAARIRCKEAAVLEGVGQNLARFVENPQLSNDAALIAGVVAAAKSHPNMALRIEAVDALLLLPSGRPERAVAADALAMDGNPALLRRVLRGMRLGEADPLRERFVAAQQALMAHPNAVVRGIAAETFGTYARRDDAAARAKLAAMLGDDVAFVRCGALRGLTQMRADTTIAAIAAVLEDHATCEAEFQEPSFRGTTRTFRVGAKTSSVSMRAAVALATISRGSKTKRELKIDRVEITDKAAVASQLAAAKAWAEKYG